MYMFYFYLAANIYNCNNQFKVISVESFLIPRKVFFINEKK